MTNPKLAGGSIVSLYTYYTGEDKGKDSILFSVPYVWLHNVLKNQFETTVAEFLDTYTWDDSELIKEWAKEDNVLQYVDRGKTE